MTQTALKDIQIDLNKLDAYLRYKGITPYSLAKKLDLSPSYVYRILHGKRKPGRQFLLGLAHLGIDLKEVSFYPNE